MEPTRLIQRAGHAGVFLSWAPEHFIVAEELAYAPCGEGEHLYLFVEKRGVTTPQVVTALARQYEVRTHSVGYAGLKDKHAVCRQWFSVHLPKSAATEAPRAIDLELDQIQVLESAVHTNKIRRGHARCNRFRLTLSGVTPALFPLMETDVASLAGTGVPNAFGPQRFQRSNVEDGLALLKRNATGRSGKRRLGRRQEFLISAVQSAVFNRTLKIRLEEDSFLTPLEGDLFYKHGSGGLFDGNQDEPANLKRRMEEQEISPTGPLPGKKMRGVQGDAAAVEARALAELDIPEDALKACCPGTRRTLRFFCTEPAVLKLQGTDQAALQLSLPPGTYATTYLDHLVRPAETFIRGEPEEQLDAEA